MISGSQLAKYFAIYDKNVCFTFYFKNCILVFILMLTLMGEKSQLLNFYYCVISDNYTFGLNRPWDDTGIKMFINFICFSAKLH